MAEQLVEELLQGRQVVGVVSPDERQDEPNGQIQQQGACGALHGFHSLGSQQPPICAKHKAIAADNSQGFHAHGGGSHKTEQV